MGSGQWKYGALLMACLAAAVAVELLTPEPLDWTRSFTHEDTRPYGSRVVYEVLPVLFPEADLRTVNQPVYPMLRDTVQGQPSYLFITQSFAPGAVEAEALLQFAERGQVVFAAAANFGGLLADTLRLDVGRSLRPPTVLEGADSTVLTFTNPSLQRDRPYRYRAGRADAYFNQFDTSRTTVLSTNGADQATFIQVNVGRGAFYLSSTPLAFTNYNMLREANAGYVYRAFSYLPARTLWWDAYYKPVRTRAQSPLRFVLRDPSLRWAFYLLLGGTLLFVVFEGKRRQRAIPTIEPPRNATLDFAKTVGQLYYHHGDHADLAEKKITYFLDGVRRRLRLNTSTIDESFLDQVAERSGVPLDEVRALFAIIARVRDQEAVTEEDLVRLSDQMERFWKAGARGRGGSGETGNRRTALVAKG